MKVYNMKAKLKESGTKIEIGSIRDWQDWPMYHPVDLKAINEMSHVLVTDKGLMQPRQGLELETPEQAEQRITKSHKTVLDIREEHARALLKATTINLDDALMEAMELSDKPE